MVHSRVKVLHLGSTSGNRIAFLFFFHFFFLGGGVVYSIAAALIMLPRVLAKMWGPPKVTLSLGRF